MRPKATPPPPPHDSRGFDFTSHVVFPFSVGMRLHYHTYIFFLPIALQGK